MWGTKPPKPTMFSTLFQVGPNPEVPLMQVRRCREESDPAAHRGPVTFEFGTRLKEMAQHPSTAGPSPPSTGKERARRPVVVYLAVLLAMAVVTMAGTALLMRMVLSAVQPQ